MCNLATGLLEFILVSISRLKSSHVVNVVSKSSNLRFGSPGSILSWIRLFLYDTPLVSTATVSVRVVFPVATIRWRRDIVRGAIAVVAAMFLVHRLRLLRQALASLPLTVNNGNDVQ